MEKIIHYCWFGGKEMPQLAQKCLKSWKKFCPDYQIMCWNEKTFDINSNKFVKEAYESKKFAFVTDYVRLHALYNYGGIYMDTDVEVIKPIDKFLENKSFSGFESERYAVTGIMGSEKGSLFIKELMDYYTNESFVKEDGSLNMIPNTQIITNILDNKGLVKNNQYQVINDEYTLYPIDYFCPIDFDTKKKNITENTYTIHWFAGSWIPLENKIKAKVYNFTKVILGDKNAQKISKSIKKKK